MEEKITFLEKISEEEEFVDKASDSILKAFSKYLQNFPDYQNLKMAIFVFEACLLKCVYDNLEKSLRESFIEIHTKNMMSNFTYWDEINSEKKDD